MLEVVEHEQQPLVPHGRRQGVLRAERLRGGILDERRICERGERHPPDTVVVVVCGGSRCLQREPRLAASARTGQRHQSKLGPSQQRRQLVDLHLATEKRGGGNREVRLVQRLQRREVLPPELEETLRRAQVLQPVEAEVAHVSIGEVDRRLRQQHLPAVPSSRDPRRPVHIEPGVALVGLKRFPRVQPHPDAHRAAGKRELRVGGGRNRIGGTPERHEERIALRIDLHPVVLPPGLPQHTAVLGKHLGITVAQLLEQPRRPLDVREEERHRPGREARAAPVDSLPSGAAPPVPT